MVEMKDSGVVFIGNIPKEWDLYSVKHLFKIGRGRVISELELDDDGKYPVYSSQTKNEGCMGYINTYDFDIDQLTWTTDGVYAGTVFIRHGKHNCTNVCGTLQPNEKNDNDLQYLKYALECIATYHRRKDINGGKIMNNEMARIKIPIPPKDIQINIAEFLDKKCAEIDALHTDIEKQIETLEEYKKSIITEAVTKGLDPDVEMKDSGIEWIGMIPKDWSTIRIGHVFSLRNERNSLPEDQVQLLSLYTGIGVFPQGEHVTASGNHAQTVDGYKIVHKNDIVVNIILAWMGAIGVSDYDGVTSPAYDIYIPDLSKVVPHYFHYVFRTAGIAGECYKYGRGIMMMRWRTYSQEFKQIFVPFPSLEKQQEIAEYLDKKCAEIDGAIEEKKQQLETLEQYKKSVIYEYVTGKKEVQ